MKTALALKSFIRQGRNVHVNDKLDLTDIAFRKMEGAGLVKAWVPSLADLPAGPELAIVLGSGPSLTADDVAAAMSLQAAGAAFVVACNATYKAAPNAAYLYGMDRAFWREYQADISTTFKGRKICPLETPWTEFVPIKAGNSGAGAILLAHQLGAKRVVLLGMDCGHTGGKTHWHGDHPAGLGNAGSLGQWPGQFAAVAAQVPNVINCSRETALTVFPRADLGETLAADCPSVHISSMHGMGDNLHQRAIVREYMRGHVVYLTSPWPELYHDLRGPRLTIVKPLTRLRTQAKNVERARFDLLKLPPQLPVIDVRYPPATVRAHRGVLPAMAAQCGVPAARDFSLPIPAEWKHGLDIPADRPIVVYRPLVERKEWGGCASRNPNAEAYVDTFAHIRAALPDCFVVSVADTEPNKEWITSADIGADVTCHKGELDITQICALWRDAALIYCAPGFGLVLAQAIGRPIVSLFGGYERAYSFRDDALTCKIEPDDPCDCFTHTHACGKKMDTARAISEIDTFLERIKCPMT